ncbi:MAG: hypothetical protein ABIP93_20225 [Gemmatimonadaceae bacterium]
MSRPPAAAARPASVSPESYTTPDAVGAANAPSPADESSLELFLSLSATLTGFNVTELWATAMVQTYYSLLPTIVGDRIFGELLSRWRDTYIRGAGDEPLLEALVTSQILDDPDFGPLARNLAALWYLGMWNQLPAEWRNVHGAWANDVTYVVSPKSYVEGLVWKAIHTHPPAAKQPGYGSWALPPVTDGDEP